MAKREDERPPPGEIGACMPWLRMELELVRPHFVADLRLVEDAERKPSP